MQNKHVASYAEASGAIQYNMTNNYMFRYILQKNKKALKGLIAALLHPEAPEFYATYKMLNVKNHLLYSDKFTLSVVNLKEIDRATKEDKTYQIDYWARIFKAKTWEDIKMLAKENEYMQEAAKSLYVANADEIVREQCRAREDAERRERTAERNYRKAMQQLGEKDAQLNEKDAQLNEKDAQLREKDSNTAYALFQNGVDYDIVRISIPSLSDEELQEIYQKVLKA